MHGEVFIQLYIKEGPRSSLCNCLLPLLCTLLHESGEQSVFDIDPWACDSDAWACDAV